MQAIDLGNYLHSEHSYKYCFSQWGVSKNIPMDVEKAAILALRKRIRGNSTLRVFYNNQAVNKKRLIRYINDQEKKIDTAENNH